MENCYYEINIIVLYFDCCLLFVCKDDLYFNLFKIEFVGR